MKKHFSEYWIMHLMVVAGIGVVIFEQALFERADARVARENEIKAEYYRRHGIDITGDEIGVGIQPVTATPIPAEAPVKP